METIVNMKKINFRRKPKPLTKIINITINKLEHIFFYN